MLFRGFPLVSRNDRLVYLQERCAASPCGLSFADLADWRDHSRSFEAIACVGVRLIALRDADGRHADLTTRIVSVFADIAKRAAVIAYDRRGIGQSQQDTERPTLRRVAASLHALLRQLGAAPPYVLVGHSPAATRPAPKLDDGGRLSAILKYAVRSLRRAPSFTFTSVLMLTLAVGAATTIFTLLNALVLRELPVRDPDKLVQLQTRDRLGREADLTWREFEELNRQQRVFSAVLGWIAQGVFTVESDQGEQRRSVMGVSGDFFDDLAVRPVVGRLIQSADIGTDSATAHRVAVIGWTFWQEHFGGDLGVIGHSLRLQGGPASSHARSADFGSRSRNVRRQRAVGRGNGRQSRELIRARQQDQYQALLALLDIRSMLGHTPIVVRYEGVVNHDCGRDPGEDDAK